MKLDHVVVVDTEQVGCEWEEGEVFRGTSERPFFIVSIAGKKLAGYLGTYTVQCRSMLLGGRVVVWLCEQGFTNVKNRVNLSQTSSC